MGARARARRAVELVARAARAIARGERARERWLGFDRGMTSASASERAARDAVERRRWVGEMRAALAVNDFEGVRWAFDALSTSGVEHVGASAWYVQMLAAAKAAQPEVALSVVEQMLAANATPDVRTHAAVMSAFVRAGRRREALDWLKMHLYGVSDGVDEGTDEKYDLNHVIGGMIDGDQRRATKRQVNPMLFTTVMNGAALAGDREMMQEIETMMFEFGVPPLADALHCMLKLERVAGTSASVEAVWNRSKMKARALKAHQERVVAHAIHGRQKASHAAEARALAVKSLEEMYERIGRKRSDEEFEELRRNNHMGTPYARWTGERGKVEYKDQIEGDEDIKKVGSKEARIATNALMSAFAEIGDVDTVNDWFIRLEEDLGVVADVRTFNALLRAEYVRSQLKSRGEVDLDETMQRFQEVVDAMEDRDIEPSTHTFSTVMQAHAAHGDMQGVAQVLKLMQERDVKLDTTMYNILLSACARAGDLEAALNARSSMAQSGVIAGPDTFIPLFAACEKQAKDFELSESGNEVFTDASDAADPMLEQTRVALDTVELDMLASDVEHNSRSYTALLKARGALGQSDIVLEMLSDVPEDVILDHITISVAVLALAKTEPTKAIAIAENFAQQNGKWDTWLLNSVLIAYVHLGQINQAFQRVQMFVEGGGVPVVSTYNTLFHCAVASGGFAEYAPRIMSEMSVRNLEPDWYTRKYLAAAAAGPSVPDREMAEELLAKCPSGRDDADFHRPSARSDGDDFDFVDHDHDDDFDDDDIV